MGFLGGSDGKETAICFGKYNFFIEMLFMFTVIINFKWINSLNFSILIYIMVNIHRYNWHKEKHPLFFPTTQTGFLIIHQEKLFPRLLIYISELKSAVSDQLPQNSIQRNSLHSKITLYQPSSSPQSLPRNRSFCRNLFMPSFLGKPGQTQRAAASRETVGAPTIWNHGFLARRPCVWGFTNALQGAEVILLNTNICPDWWDKSFLRSSIIFWQNFLWNLLYSQESPL